MAKNKITPEQRAKELADLIAYENQEPEIRPDSFEVIGADPYGAAGIVRPSMSYWKDAMRRLALNKVAIACFCFLMFIIVMCIVVPEVSPYTIEQMNVRHQNKGFFYDPGDGNINYFGTDQLGRDIFVRVWSGARISMQIAFTAVAINCAIGVLYGGISGYAGGNVDNVMMRIVEIISGIPYLIIVLLLMSVMKPGISAIIIAYATVGWTGMARLVRGQVMTLKQQEYVIAAQTMGTKPLRIIFKHLLPNTLSVVIVNITLAIPNVIFTEAFLSFLGLGVPIPTATWGNLAYDGVSVFQQYPHMLFIPAAFISLTMLSFNLLGDALRDVFDPRLRK